MSGPPVIGITAYEEDARWGAWSERAALVPVDYIRAVERAGGAAILLPIQSRNVASLFGRIDALVLTGGPDVDSSRYGQDRHVLAQRPRVERDAFELALLELATDRDTPTLAICRGVQLLNVARGGTIHQHLPEVVGHLGHTPATGEYAWHEVVLDKTSRLATELSAEVVKIASHHHQAIAQVGRGLRIVARAEDGTIEAVEDPDLSYLVGVQWHPEVGDDLSIFESLIAAVGDKRALSR